MKAALIERRRFAGSAGADSAGKALPLRFTRFRPFREVNARFRDVRIRANADVAQFVDVIIVIAPPGNYKYAASCWLPGAHRYLMRVHRVFAAFDEGEL